MQTEVLLNKSEHNLVPGLLTPLLIVFTSSSPPFVHAADISQEVHNLYLSLERHLVPAQQTNSSVNFGQTEWRNNKRKMIVFRRVLMLNHPSRHELLSKFNLKYEVLTRVGCFNILTIFFYSDGSVHGEPSREAEEWTNRLHLHRPHTGYFTLCWMFLSFCSGWLMVHVFPVIE